MPNYFCKTWLSGVQFVCSEDAGDSQDAAAQSASKKEIQELCRAQDQLAEISLSAGVRQKARSSQHSSAWHAEQNRAANLNPGDLQDSRIPCSLLRMAYCILAATEIRTVFLQLWNCQGVVNRLKPSTFHNSVTCIFIFIKQFIILYHYKTVSTFFSSGIDSLLFSYSANFLGISPTVLFLLFLLTFTISALSHLWSGGAG